VLFDLFCQVICSVGDGGDWRSREADDLVAGTLEVTDYPAEIAAGALRAGTFGYAKKTWDKKDGILTLGGLLGGAHFGRP